MAARSLTEVFILMRNNAQQNRHFFSEQVGDDRMALVGSKEVDIELGPPTNKLPPEWINGVEDIQYDFTKINQKMKEVIALHDKHLNRPNFTEAGDERSAIESETHEVTALFAHCHRQLHSFSNRARKGTPHEVKLAENIRSSLARTLQDLSTVFRKSQSEYLKKLKQREERSRGYFEIDAPANQEDDDEYGLLEYYDRGFSQDQQQIVQDNSSFVEEREREINQIVKSIQELNEIFRDVAELVVDQGTLVDRIDFHVEKAHVKVEEGLNQLKKAEKYQKKNRKILIIVFLAILLVILVVVLIATKFN